MPLGNSKNELSEIVAALEALLSRDTILTRRQLAEKSKEANVPVAESSLASMASRGTGPTFTKYGNRSLYRWGGYIDWVVGKSTAARSTSEHRAKAVA